MSAYTGHHLVSWSCTVAYPVWHWPCLLVWQLSAEAAGEQLYLDSCRPPPGFLRTEPKCSNLSPGVTTRYHEVATWQTQLPSWERYACMPRLPHAYVGISSLPCQTPSNFRILISHILTYGIVCTGQSWWPIWILLRLCIWQVLTICVGCPK